IRPSTDPATLAAAKRSHEAHLKIIELDRARLLRNEQLALEAKHNGDPLRHVSCQADAAGQIGFGLPMQDTVTHGTDRGYAERQKVHAVHVEGQFVEIFLTPQNLGGGCNLICTSIHRILHRLFEMYVPVGKRPYIYRFTIQVDNCVSENKNHIVIGYLGSLVAQGIIGEVEVQFMPVGHTHIKIDQVFSRLAVGCKRRNLFTRGQQAEAFSAAYKTLPVHTTTLRNLGNYKGVFIPGVVVKRLGGMTKARAFQLLKDGPTQVTVGMKEFMHHEVYTGMTGDGVFAGKPHEVFVGGIPDAADAPPFELKAVEQDTLVKIQQRYDSVVPRLEALFPDGKTLCHLAFRWITVEWSWCVFTNGFSTHTYNSGFSTPSSSGDESPGGDGTGDSGALDTMSPEALPDGPLTESGGGGAGNSLRLQPGWFAVLPLEMTNTCPLVVGQIVSVESGGENGGEVLINWFAPVSRKKCRRSRYGRGVWSQQFLKQDNKLTPDQSTESIKSVCFTFQSLLQSGKLPSGVWAAVEESVPSSSLEEAETDDSDSDADGVEGGGAAGGCRGEEQSGLAPSPTIPPHTRDTGPIPHPSRSDSQSAPPAPGVRLTAAHFRPRRTQQG
ncbi:unnamed protein product, partial [Ectocarpus sp. 12 AP-2014]